MARSLNQMVAGRLRQDIITGRLQPGQRIPEDRLASAYGVSRAPIREAIHRLDAEGFVTVVPNCGATVALIGPDEAGDLLAVRAAVEVLVARQAAERADPDDLAGLKGLLVQAKEALAAQRWDDLAGLNTEFHLSLARASRNTTALGLLTQLQHKMTWIYIYSEGAPLRAEDSWDEHGKVVDAITVGDADAAGAAIALHLANADEAFHVPRSVA